MATADDGSIQLSDIPTLSHDYRNKALLPVHTTRTPFTPSAALNSKVSLIRTSITDLQVTSIVNAANTSLLGGGGVVSTNSTTLNSCTDLSQDGAIHAAAGPDLLRECETLDGCDTGFAKITSAYELPSEYVIHAVGPIYGREKRKRDGLQAELLASCYATSLDLAADKGGSIAFSCLSTGVYGYPSNEAAEVACRTVRAFLGSEKGQMLDRVVFCCFLQKDEVEYQRILPMFFPPTEAELNNTNNDTEKPEENTAQHDAKPDASEKSSSSPLKGRELDEDSWIAVETPKATTESGAVSATTDVENIAGKTVDGAIGGDSDFAHIENETARSRWHAKS
ncbi:MAG: hypothetical protein Q9182_003906 [Xanthomendoza sp. 2 TL-2023]